MPIHHVMGHIMEGTLILDWLRMLVVEVLVPCWSIAYTVMLRYMSIDWLRMAMVDGIFPCQFMAYMVWMIVPCKLSISSLLTLTVVSVCMLAIMGDRILKKHIQV